MTGRFLDGPQRPVGRQDRFLAGQWRWRWDLNSRKTCAFHAFEYCAPSFTTIRQCP